MAVVPVSYALCRRYHDDLSHRLDYRQRYCVVSLDVISFARQTTTLLKSFALFFLKPVPNAIAASIEPKFVDPNLITNLYFLESQITSSPNHDKYLCGSELSGAESRYVGRLELSESRERAVQEIIDIDGFSSDDL